MYYMIVDIHINLYNIPPLVVHVGTTHTYVCLKGMKQKIIIKKTTCKPSRLVNDFTAFFSYIFYIHFCASIFFF